MTAFKIMYDEDPQIRTKFKSCVQEWIHLRKGGKSRIRKRKDSIYKEAYNIEEISAPVIGLMKLAMYKVKVGNPKTLGKEVKTITVDGQTWQTVAVRWASNMEDDPNIFKWTKASGTKVVHKKDEGGQEVLDQEQMTEAMAESSAKLHAESMAPVVSTMQEEQKAIKDAESKAGAASSTSASSSGSSSDAESGDDADLGPEDSSSERPAKTKKKGAPKRKAVPKSKIAVVRAPASSSPKPTTPSNRAGARAFVPAAAPVPALTAFELEARNLLAQASCGDLSIQKPRWVQSFRTKVLEPVLKLRKGANKEAPNKVKDFDTLQDQMEALLVL